MPFPLIPVVLGSLAAWAGYEFLVKDDKPAPKPAPTPTPGKANFPSNASDNIVPNFVPGVLDKDGKLGKQIPNVRPIPTPPTPPRPQPGPAPVGPGIDAYVTAVSGLNIRKEPNTSSSILTLVPYNNKVKLPEPSKVYPPTSGAPKGWKQVTTGSGISGYASAEWLSESLAPSPQPSPGPAPVPVPPPGGAIGTVIAMSGLTLRALPNASSNAITLMPMGTKVKVVDMTIYPATAGAPDGWLKVMENIKGRTGYASRQWLMMGASDATPIGPAPADPSILPKPDDSPNPSILPKPDDSPNPWIMGEFGNEIFSKNSGLKS